MASYNDLVTAIARAQTLTASRLGPTQTYGTAQASALLNAADGVMTAAQAFAIDASVQATAAGGTDLAAQFQTLADYIANLGTAQLAPYRAAVAAALVGNLPAVTFTPPANSAQDVPDSPAGTRDALVDAGLAAAPDLRGVILYLLDRYSVAVNAVRAVGVLVTPGPITVLFDAITRFIDTVLKVAKAISYLIPALIYGGLIVGAGIGTYFLVKWVKSSRSDRAERREAHQRERERVLSPRYV